MLKNQHECEEKLYFKIKQWVGCEYHKKKD